MEAAARARANIALAKYWGKADDEHNLPAVPSVSITLDPLVTKTRVRFDAALKRDAFTLGGEPAREEELARVTALLDRVRRESGVTAFATVESDNRFPTASGLASSASGFAALACAARAAADLPFDRDAVSRLARSASVSAARSAFGGFVELADERAGDDDPSAVPVAPPEHWDVCVVVAVTDEGRKGVGSSDGMRRTRETSPLYPAWVAAAPALADEVRAGILARDLARVGSAMEQSTFAFHASAMAAVPPLLYMRPATLSALERVRALRDVDRVGAWATMDAGPHVKVLCEAGDAARVEAAMARVQGVLRVLVGSPGPGVEIL
jgi:diphosphomevalonate decarboxylase